MAFIDEVTLSLQAGSGGNGCVSFRREKYVPYGGPNGGDGGKGGDVWLVATHDKSSLLDFKYQPRYEADRGQHGMGKDMYGRGGEDLKLLLPVGTLVYDGETGDLICDLAQDGQTFLAAKGGKGGRGNLSFVSSRNRAPRTATPGETGEIKTLKLELRLMADVGLLGLPNAGKSSFLSRVSHARPKVADYPFTTLQPHLGVVENKGRSFVVADLPGLIEGASQGAGLGIQFLKHVSRNRMLLHLVDITTPVEEIAKQIKVIRKELKSFDPDLLKRPTELIFTKADLLSSEDLKMKEKELTQLGFKGTIISSQSGYGIPDLLDRLTTQSTHWMH